MVCGDVGMRGDQDTQVAAQQGRDEKANGLRFTRTRWPPDEMNITAARRPDGSDLLFVQHTGRRRKIQLPGLRPTGCCGKTEQPLAQSRVQRPLPSQNFLVAL